MGRNNSSINVKDISQENEHTRYSPLVYARDVAKKKEEIMRVCNDYREFNKMTNKNE